MFDRFITVQSTFSFLVNLAKACTDISLENHEYYNFDFM